MLFLPAGTTGALNGTFTEAPAAGELDEVELVQSFSFAGVEASFVVQSAPVTPNGTSPGTFSFPTVAPGTYRAILHRYNDSSVNGILDQRTVTASFLIKPGQITVITF